MDESGNSGSSLDPDQPIHWLVAIGVTPSAVRDIEKEMLNLALEHFPFRARQPDFEFHGSDLFSGRGECKGVSPDVRIQIFDTLMGLLKKHDCILFIRGINKSLHHERARDRGYQAEHPHKLGCMYLFERIDEWLEQRSQEDSRNSLGLLIADEQKEVHREIISRFAHWRDRGTEVGYRQRKIRFLIDTVHYVPSHDSWLIQLADCVSFLRNRCSKVYRNKGFNPSSYSESDQAILRMWGKCCRECVVSDVVWP